MNLNYLVSWGKSMAIDLSKHSIKFGLIVITLITAIALNPSLTVAERPKAPKTATPSGNTTPGTTRPEANCPATPKPLTALVANQGQDFTVAEYPTWLFYIPYTAQEISLMEFLLLIEGDYIYLPKIKLVRAVFDRRYSGKIKTVTVTKDSSDRYFASILYELEACFVSGNGDKIIGLDLGIKDLIIAHDGTKTSKYNNPKHFKKHEKNLARKQQKLSRKRLGSKTRAKAKKLVAKIHARISNARQDYLHKLSRKLTNESQVIVVENLNVKGMVRNHKLAKAISDSGWGTLVNFLDYKLERENKRLVEIDRWFPSSHICPDCLTQQPKMDLSVREWICINRKCLKKHDRDEAASKNIRAEGIRIIKAEGIPASASGGSIRPDRGRKTKVRQHPAKLETRSKRSLG